MNKPCPCGLSQEFEQCCGKYIDGNELPPTPEALMRSRYSAYALGNVTYLIQTMTGEPLANFDEADTLDWLKNVQWQGLKVIKTHLKSDKLGYVSFEARLTHQGANQAILEKSEFHKIDGKWLYVSGKALNPNKKW